MSCAECYATDKLMYCLSADPSRILEGSANRVGKLFAVGGDNKVFFTGTIYDDAVF